MKPQNIRIAAVLFVLIIGVTFTSILIGMARAQTVVQGWEQRNDDGFGNPDNYVISALEVYGDYLYAGTWNQVDPAQIWRTDNGQNWSDVTPSWSISNEAALDKAVFGNYLYVGTWNDVTNGGEIWRTNGTVWDQVVTGGFTNTTNEAINTLVVFSNTLYAATTNFSTGLELWRSLTGDTGSWEHVYAAGADTSGGSAAVTMDVYDNSLYLGARTDGFAHLIRSNDGINWTTVFSDSLGNSDNTHVSAMATFGGRFYIAFRNVTTGGEVWRSDNGITWTPVFTGGLGNIHNERPYGLIVYANELYLMIGNDQTGSEIWKSPDGSSWQQVVNNGWDDSGNIAVDYFDKASTVYRSSLYVGTRNNTGGEIWQKLQQIYLPVILK